jgi:hypothetical protein
MPIGDILPYFDCVPFEKLASYLRERDFCHVDGKGEGIRNIRFYHTRTETDDIYCISNEAITQNADITLSLENKGGYYIYEPWNNKCYSGKTENGQVHLRLEKGNLVFVVFSKHPTPEYPEFRCEIERHRLDLKFDIYVKDEDHDDFVEFALDSPPVDISSARNMEHFSGEIKYKALFPADDNYTVIDLGEVGETAEVWLNGEFIGSRINPPYKFSLKQALRENNEITIIVRSNLAHKRRDRFSKYLQIPPTGVIGDIYLCKYW